MNLSNIQTLNQTEIDFFHAIKDSNIERFLEITVLKDFNINIFYHISNNYKYNNKNISLYDALVFEEKHKRKICYPVYLDTIYNENIKKVHTSYKTPLMLACLFGNFLFVKLLLENGAFIDAIDPISYETALTIAVNMYHENIDIITILLEKGSNPNQYICEYLYKEEQYDKESGGTADEVFKYRWNSTLYIAINKITKNNENKLKTIELLLDFGADINSQYEKHMLDKDTNYPFTNETEFRNFWGVMKVRTRSLLSYVINDPYIQKQPIQFSIINLLIERNADINYIDPDNKTALEYVVCSKDIIEPNKFEIIKKLVEYGADLLHGNILQYIDLHCSNNIKQFVKEYLEREIVLK